MRRGKERQFEVMRIGWRRKGVDFGYLPFIGFFLGGSELPFFGKGVKPVKSWESLGKGLPQSLFLNWLKSCHFFLGTILK